MTIAEAVSPMRSKGQGLSTAHGRILSSSGAASPELSWPVATWRPFAGARRVGDAGGVAELERGGGKGGPSGPQLLERRTRQVTESSAAPQAAGARSGENACARPKGRANREASPTWLRARCDKAAYKVLSVSLSGAELQTDNRAPVSSITEINRLRGKVARHAASGIAIEFVGVPDVGRSCASRVCTARRGFAKNGDQRKRPHRSGASSLRITNPPRT